MEPAVSPIAIIQDNGVLHMVEDVVWFPSAPMVTTMYS